MRGLEWWQNDNDAPSGLDLIWDEVDREQEAMYQAFCREFDLDPDEQESARDWEANYRWWLNIEE